MKIITLIFKNIKRAASNFLVWSNFFALILSFASYPIISTLYEPKDYGLLGVFMAVIGIATIFVNSQFNYSISLSLSDTQRVNSFFLSIIVLFFVSLVFYILMYVLVLSHIVFESQNIHLICFFSWLCIVGIGINYNLTLLVSSIKSYKILAFGRIIQVGVSVFLQLLAFRYKEYGLLSAAIFSIWIVNFFYIIMMYNLLKKKFKYISKIKMKYISVRYRRLVIYSLPSDLLNSTISNLPVFFIQKVYSLEFLGQFNFASKLLSIPSSIFSTAFADTFRQSARDEKNECNNTSLSFKKYFGILATVNIVIFIPIIWFSDIIFDFFFDIKWKQAATITSVLAWFYLLRGVVAPLTYVYHIFDRQKEDFITHIIFLIMLSLFLSITFYSGFIEKTFLIGFCFFNVLLYFYYGIRSYYISKA